MRRDQRETVVALAGWKRTPLVARRQPRLLWRHPDLENVKRLSVRRVALAVQHAGAGADSLKIAHSLAEGRHAWVHVIRGAGQLNGLELRCGDGAAVSDESVIEWRAMTDSETLFFDVV